MSFGDFSLKMDLGLLPAQDREKVLEVLRRDKQLRTIEENRIRRMKHDLQELRRRGAKSYTHQYGERTCARCQRPLGKFWNSGALCLGCSHRICSRCRVGVGREEWRCTVCHAHREVKFRSGDWFIELRANKFPVAADKYETTGEKLLQAYSVQSSYISVIPPTPPPHLDHQFLGRLGDFKNSKPFTKSLENLMVSFTSQIKKISTSQNDVNEGLLSVDGNLKMSRFPYTTQKSLSDTEINRSSHLYHGPSLPNLFKKGKDSDQEGSSTGAEEETSFGSEYSVGKRGSNSSIGTDCGVFESVSVMGELELSLHYNRDTFCLEVTVGAGRNLSYGDPRKKQCHPYVKLCVLPEKSSKLKTAVKKHTTNPIFNEVLKYPVERHLLIGKRLQASVWHSRTLKRKTFLGEVLIPLDGWRFDDKAFQGFNWYPLCPKGEDSAEQH